MDLKQYNAMVLATDKLREYVDEDTAEAVLNTWSCSVRIVEQYCEDNIPGFKENGKVVNFINVNDEDLSQEMEIVVNGKALTEAAMEPHLDKINELLDKVYGDLGWGELRKANT